MITFILVTTFRLSYEEIKTGQYLLPFYISKKPSSTVFLEKYLLRKYILISLKLFKTVDIFTISSDYVKFFKSGFIWLQQISYFVYYLNSILKCIPQSFILLHFIDL